MVSTVSGRTGGSGDDHPLRFYHNALAESINAVEQVGICPGDENQIFRCSGATKMGETP